MERIKDILFDLSDIAFSLIIIAVMFFVVSWQLNDAMPIQMTLFKPDAQTQDIAPTSDIPRTTIDITVSENAGTPNEQIGESQQTTVATGQGAQETTVKNINQESLTITIPPGSSGNKIATILLEKGIIKDSNTFLKVVSNLNLGSKLRAGKFKLNPNMSNEEVAKIIAGKK